MAGVLIPPIDLELRETERGLLIRGPAESIDGFCRDDLRTVASLCDGGAVTCGEWTFMVSEIVVVPPMTRTIAIPAHAWNIAASVLADVAYGEYDSPLYFSDVGYLDPPPSPDIGVDVVGGWIGQTEGRRGVTGRPWLGKVLKFQARAG